MWDLYISGSMVTPPTKGFAVEGPLDKMKCYGRWS